VDEKTSNPTQAKEQPGFYDEQFLKGELADLKLTSLNSLEEEIELLRVVNRRLVDHLRDDMEPEIELKYIRVIAELGHKIGSLVSSQNKLGEKEDFKKYLMRILEPVDDDILAINSTLPPRQYPSLLS
jgi:hypothetical protein